ncbi:MAG: PH domain-containing protein [Pyrinomonadaceae bacterium]|nr:PH domain-containing protein [Pyrinomonadaceae bacterium]
MYCGNCGTDNADDSLYCKKCGKLMEHEEETRVAVKDASGAGMPAVRSEDGSDEPIFSITPTIKFVIAGYVIAAIAAVVLVALMSMLFPGLGSVAGVIAGLSLLAIPALYHIRQRLVRYTLTETKLEIDSGFVSRTTTNVPLGRVQDVTVTRTIAQRLLGMGDIVVDNAGGDGRSFVMKNIDSPRKYADQLLRQMGDVGRGV